MTVICTCRYIQVLVCTSTLAWGVNFPAHLVVVKGTEFFDGKSQRYVDFPITDLLQVRYVRTCAKMDSSRLSPRKRFGAMCSSSVYVYANIVSVSIPCSFRLTRALSCST